MNLVVSLLMLVMTSHLEVVRAQGVQCHVAAKVQGVFSGVDSATDYNDCLVKCSQTFMCNWFTFYSDISDCVYFSEFFEFDYSCSFCESGQKECLDLSTTTQSTTTQSTTTQSTTTQSTTTTTSSPVDPNSQHKMGVCSDSSELVNQQTLSVNECIRLAKATTNAMFYSYSPTDYSCLVTEDCVGVDTSCPDCSYGSVAVSEFNQVLVAGGLGGVDRDVEVVEVGSNGAVCADLDDLPVAYGARGVYLNFSIPVVCGGGDIDASADCFALQQSSWSDPIFTMTTPRASPEAVMFSSQEIWILGGKSSSGDWLISTEICSLTSYTCTASENLPMEAREEPRVTKIDANTFFLYNGNKAWMLDTNSMTWTPQPDAPEQRREPQVGMVSWPDFTRSIVVAGGESTNTTSIFNLAGSSWSSGPTLPVVDSLCFGAVVPFDNSFLIVGGYSYGSNDKSDQDQILFFDVVASEWVIMEDSLTHSRHDTMALLGSNIVSCSNE